MLVISQEVTMKQIGCLFRFGFIVTLMKKLVLFLILLCLWPVLANATVYYVANAGNDSCNGTSSSLGSSGACAWQSIAHVNAQTFKPGDSVLFQAGGTWREQLIVHSSGNAGNPITFGMYGTGANPRILASVSANSAGNWTQDGSTNFWYTKVSSNMVTDAYPSGGACAAWRDNAQLLLVTAERSLANTGQCYWDSGTQRLYVYASANPTAGSHTFEIGQRSSSIAWDNKSYITFDSLFLGYNNNLGNASLWSDAGSSYITVQNSELAYGLGNGIRYYGTTLGSNWHITNNYIHNYWSHGISTADPSTISGWHIDHNTIANTAQKDSNNPAAGIYFIGDSTGAGAGTCTNNLIEHNTVYGSGLARGAAEGPSATNISGDGIWLDTCGQVSQGGNTGNIIRYNLVHDNNCQGIRVEYTDGVSVYYNLVYNHTQQPSTNVGIALNRHVHNNIVYNNTVYNSGWGIEVAGQYSTPPINDVTNNIVTNNISDGNSKSQLLVYNGGQNHGIYGSGNIYTYNNFGAPSSQMIEWTLGTYLASYAALDKAYGSATHSVAGDPLFASTSTANFQLQAGSPAIYGGVNVGLTTDYAGNSVHNPPSIGAYEYGEETAPAAPGNLRIGGQ
jgi:hypothetical protein